MSSQQRPLPSAPLDSPRPGPFTAQCIILGSSRRPLCNQPLRDLFTAVAAASDAPSARAFRRRFWRRVSAPAQTSLRSGQRLYLRFGLLFLGTKVHVTVSCRPVRGKRRNTKASHCFVTVEGLDHVLDRPARPDAAQAPNDPSHELDYPWPMYMLSSRGRPIWLNAASRRFLGLQQNNLNQNPLDIVHPDEQLLVHGLWQEALDCCRPLQLFARLKAASGAYVTCLVRADPRIDESGSVRHWVCTTLETQQHQWLGPSRPAAEAEGIGNSFLTVASHELRTPLTSLQLNLQLALQRLQRHRELPGREAGIESMVSRSLKQTHRLIEVVSDILDASRIHLGKLQLRQSRVDLHQLLLDTLALFDRPFADVGCRVTVQLPDHIIYGHWDRGRVEQVFFDLLANVLKHAPGSHVTVTAQVQGEEAVVRVQDDGPGIDQALHERIFGRFGRAAECRGISGLGLGLYLCRRIVEDHGGSLQVHSTKGAGCAFVARLPLAGAAASNVRFAQALASNRPRDVRS